MTHWLTILGIGEDGIEGLTPAARTLLANATFVIGGARHLALAESLIHGDHAIWPSPIENAIPDVIARSGTPVVVLASGDPTCFGIATTLARHIPFAETLILPQPSAFSLACARLGWAQQNIATISFCGRPLAAIIPLLQPGRHILALSADATTPVDLAALLAERGFGPSRLHLLEALGGPQERIRTTTGANGLPADIHPLNLIAIEVKAEPNARIIPLASGLPDNFFEHDGQITKQEIRAVTLAALSPRAGETLWDVGCGSGSIAIEWLLRHTANRAIAIDRHPERLARAARNTLSLGVPQLRFVQGSAPAALADLPQPDAVFIGGGATAPEIIPTIWSRLRPGGRLVANAVTIETESVLLRARESLGGTLTRISIERLDSIGRMHGFRPAMPVTQWTVTKP